MRHRAWTGGPPIVERSPDGTPTAQDTPPEARTPAAQPDSVEAHHALCLRLLRAGRNNEAVAAGQAAVASRPGSASLRMVLGAAYEAMGDLAGAAASLRAATEIEPDSAGGFLKLADIMRRLGSLEAALNCALRSTALSPEHHGARIICALILDQLGRHDEAAHAFTAAARLCPPSPEALNSIGVICIDQGRFAAATDVLRRAVHLDPGSAEFHGNLALSLQREGKLREAFEAGARAVTIDPTNVVAQCNLAGLLIDAGHLEAATSACSLALQFDPGRLEAHLYLGIALRRQGRTADALTSFRRALALRPDSGEALNEICDMRLQAGDWPGLEAERSAAMEHGIGKGKRVPPFQVLALTASPAEQQRAARVWASAFGRTATPLASYAPRPAGQQGRRLRVGYLSADFRTHATAMLIAELFERQDRRRVELFGYSCGADDRSSMRQRLVGALDRFADIRSLGHREAAGRIHADGIDILIDLKGYTREARPEILAHRPASIQVNFLGYPGTMGASFIDYMIADRFVAPPETAASFDEKLVYLPHSYQSNDRSRVTGPPPSRHECGLPEKGFVFCCLNNTYKITPIIFDIWMRLLRRRPDAVFWLFEGDGAAAANLRREAAARGVGPERLVFAPKVLPEAHLARLALADLFLDTLPVNAHTTASEALWVGLPIVTCAGEAFAARVAGSLLKAVGLPELITTSLADYEALASSLADDSARLSRLRGRLIEGRGTVPLFDTARYARNFDAALTRMAELRDLGRLPEAFSVEET